MRKIDDFKPFVPSNDYAVSKAFYECMGFAINRDDGEVCILKPKKVRFDNPLKRWEKSFTEADR